MSNAAMGNAVTRQAAADGTRMESFQFRAILGHYPTGTVVVTALADDGEPIGMTVGSFTSVSLDPPLIGFLPTRESRTFARLRTTRAFCVNVLAADQEWLCRRFAGAYSAASKGAGSKFDGVSWSPSPSGAPVLGDVVAWIDCELAGITDAGDHYFVLGRVTELQAVRPVQPLLFFQGGYGRFVPLSRTAVGDAEVIAGTRLAEAARPAMEALAAELGCECSALAAAGGDLVVVAAAPPPGRETASVVGRRIPLRPPLGELYVAWQGKSAADDWLASAPAVDAETLANYRRRLDLARARGWSMSLTGGSDRESDSSAHERLYDALREFSWHELTPARQRVIEQEIEQVSQYYEPVELDPDARYDLHSLVAPVFDAAGRVSLVLRLSRLPRQAVGAGVQHWLDRLLATAAALSTASPAADGNR